MFEVHLQGRGRPRYVRVWVENLPESTYPVAEILRTEVATAAVPRSRPAEIAVEWQTPGCGPSTYGLLGAHLAPAPTGPLVVEVAVSPPDPLVFDHPDALQGCPGLPMEYAASVLRSARASAAIRSLGPGMLRFDRAIDDPVGSSSFVFGWLAEVIVRILMNSGEPLTQDELERLVEFG